MSVQTMASTSAVAAREQLMQLATGYMPAACLNVAVRLKIADQLARGPKPAKELARAASVNEDALYRVLRALASVGVFVEVTPRTFAQTEASRHLASSESESLREMVLWMSDQFHFRVYSELMHSVQTGGTVIEKLWGCDCFQYFDRDKTEGEVFHAAMSSFSGMETPAILDAYDFNGLNTLADIAGGHGYLLTSILQKHADVRGILFDLPQVVAGAKSRIASMGLDSRCKMASGNFFEAVPPADNYVMKHIIHDWDDARALTILQNCASAMRGKGKVIVIDMVISPGNQPHFAKWLDIEMLTMPGGRERTEDDFADLFFRAGLRLSRIVRTKAPVCVVEAVKV
ncbi:MAG: methyltransferase [Acidobacteria bacterium]|nr:methyltransferase [Acidobacteriota bacterium]